MVTLLSDGCPTTLLMAFFKDCFAEQDLAMAVCQMWGNGGGVNMRLPASI